MSWFKIAVVLTLAATLVAGPAPAGAAEPAVWVPSMVNQPQGLTSVDLFEDGTGYVHRTDSTGTYFWKSEDGGSTYLPAPLPPGPFVDFASPDVGYSASFSGLWTTGDAAASWQDAALPAPGSARQDAISALHVGAGGHRVALGVTSERTGGPCPWDHDSGRAEVTMSTDGAMTWERITLLDAPARVQQVEFVSDDFGVAIVSEISWTQTGPCGFSGAGTLGQLVYVLQRQPSGLLEARQVFDCRPRICGSVGVAADGVFTLGFTNGATAHTADSGASFAEGRLAVAVPDAVGEASGQPNAFWVTEIEFADAEVGYAVTNGRGMWRTDDGGASWVTEPSTRDVYDLGVADVGVAGRESALAGGPALVVRRQPTP